MRDYLNIGSSPANECCSQVGEPDYYKKAIIECRAFKHQLIRMFGNPPEYARLTVKSFSHDFGTYHEVVCYFDDNNEESMDYAFKLENEMPENWDEEAKKEIKEALACKCSL